MKKALVIFPLIIFLLALFSYEPLWAQCPFPLLRGKYSIKEKRLLLKNGDLKPIRLIPLLIYYPATEVSSPSNNLLADYAPLPLLQSYGIEGALGGMKKRATVYSSPDLSSPFPVIFFSPGLSIPSDFYTALLEEIASHGFVIIAFSHPGMSGNVYNPEDHSVIPMMDLPEDHQEMVELLQKLIPLNLQDFAYTQKYFSSLLNFSSYWVMGHSGGGMSATLYCDQIPSSCSGAINLDGGDYNGIGIEVTGAWPSHTELPYLKIHSQSFPQLDHIPSNVMGKNQFLIDLKGVDHSTFTDKAFFPGMILPHGFELIDPHDAHQVITHLILKFLAKEDPLP